jgi:hypothetical protein
MRNAFNAGQVSLKLKFRKPKFSKLIKKDSFNKFVSRTSSTYCDTFSYKQTNHLQVVNSIQPPCPTKLSIVQVNLHLNKLKTEKLFIYCFHSRDFMTLQFFRLFFSIQINNFAVLAFPTTSFPQK